MSSLTILEFIGLIKYFCYVLINIIGFFIYLLSNSFTFDNFCLKSVVCFPPKIKASRKSEFLKGLQLFRYWFILLKLNQQIIAVDRSVFL